MQVELIKPKAQEFNRELGKEIDIDVKQYTIMVDGKGLGYVCQAEGLPINWLPVANAYSRETLDQLEVKVNAELVKLHGETAGGRSATPPLSQESVDEAIEIAAKMAEQENSIDGPDQDNL